MKTVTTLESQLWESGGISFLVSKLSHSTVAHYSIIRNYQMFSKEDCRFGGSRIRPVDAI